MEDTELHIPSELPVLPVRDTVIFPHMIVPLFVGREKSLQSIETALSSHRLMFLVAQKDASADEPESGDLYEVGTVAVIMRRLKMPDGRQKILVQGLCKAQVRRYDFEGPYLIAHIERLMELEQAEPDIETEALMQAIRKQVGELQELGKEIPAEVLIILQNMEDPGTLADLVASNLALKISQAQELLEMLDPLERLRRIKRLLDKEHELLKVQQHISSRAREEISKTQREYFLREQMRAIRSELNEKSQAAEDLEDLKIRLREAGMPENAQKEAEKTLRRLESMSGESAEASMLRTYLDWLVELPWNKATVDNLDINGAKKVLDEDHFDLEKVKDRILEFLAVRKLKPQIKGPILCFVGPPGVGKTSLGKSIARALEREFVRLSLGGMRDEAELRGHRRTYVGALPGRIIQGLKQAGTHNPVFMLDEVDKLGADFRGDPSSALLEILDPEQNHSFSDHYINLPFDLSRVMFIATANILDPIPSALKDRMEVIRLAGYSTEEKLAIARRFLVPRQIEANGLKEEDIRFSPAALRHLITDYTREAGLRNLEREIGSICRKVARRLAEGKKPRGHISVNSLAGYLGPVRFLREERTEDETGVATGLAWTEVGGEIIHVEASTMKGKGKLTLTGHLGEVMKESAQAALSYARAHAGELGIDESLFAESDIHIHVPAGAIPKDGPSAGVTMATALISALSRKPVRRKLAMTGEITLRGKVLPVGGIKEKVLAAVRSRIPELIIPRDNEKDLAEIPPHIKRKLRFILAGNMNDVLKSALREDA